MLTEYFATWRRRAESREDYCDKMLLSNATEHGVVVTSKSMVELVKECLHYGAPHIITRRCNQDQLILRKFSH